MKANQNNTIANVIYIPPLVIFASPTINRYSMMSVDASVA